MIQCTYSDALIVLHGGAGQIFREHLTPAREEACRSSLRAAITVGVDALHRGGSAVDAVCACVAFLEDDPLFNAGRGSVLAHDGTAQMDAALMDGRDRSAGAVTGIMRVRNPILLARRVKDDSPFVMMVGQGAEEFAAERGVDLIDNAYFVTPERKAQLAHQLSDENYRGLPGVSLSEDNKFGTVGAVARDANGHVAAATSTGGMTNKRYGRVGDSPIIGAGTWADDATCAISATGHGEYFIRNAVAHDIAARIAYGGQTLADAASVLVHDTLKPLGGDGGVIGIDGQGSAVLPFNTPGMYRAVALRDGRIDIGIYADETAAGG